MKWVVSVFLLLTLQSCAILSGEDRYVYYFSPTHYETNGIRGYVQVPSGKIFPYTHVHNVKTDDRWYSRMYRDAFCVGYGTMMSATSEPINPVWPAQFKLNKINDQ